MRDSRRRMLADRQRRQLRGSNLSIRGDLRPEEVPIAHRRRRKLHGSTHDIDGRCEISTESCGNHSLLKRKNQKKIKRKTKNNRKERQNTKTFFLCSFLEIELNLIIARRSSNNLQTTHLRETFQRIRERKDRKTKTKWSARAARVDTPTNTTVAPVR